MADIDMPDADTSPPSAPPDTDSTRPTFYHSLGIDFGTSGIKMYHGVMGQDGKWMITPGPVAWYGDTLVLPSDVAVHDDKVYMGKELLSALEKDLLPAEKVVKCAKLGLYLEDGKHVQGSLMHRVARAIEISGLRDVSDLIARQMKELVRRAIQAVLNSGRVLGYGQDLLSSLPIRARLSIPQMWSPTARAKMQFAAEKAGIEYVVFASEPICALAAALDNMTQQAKSDQFSISHGETFTLVDPGCGTVDAITMRQEGADTSKATFQVIHESSGSACGSQMVNEHIFEQIMVAVQKNKEKYPDGIEGEYKRLDISKEHFEFLLLRDIESAKLAYPEKLVHRCGVCKSEEGEDFDFRITRTMVETALRDVLEQVVQQVKDLVDEEKPSYILVAGGFGKNPDLQKVLKETFEPEGITVKFFVDFHKGDPLLVGQGTLSSRYGSIKAQDLPRRYGYGLLQDQPYDGDIHTDVWYKSVSKSGRNSRRFYENKICRGWLHPDPSKPGKMYVIDRVKVLLAKGQAPVQTDPLTVDMEYGVSAADPVISARFVYFTEHIKSDEPALAANHDVKKTKNPLRPGVHRWTKVFCRFTTAELDSLGCPTFITDDGDLLYELKTEVMIEHNSEQDMKIKWIAKGSNGQTLEKQAKVWDAKSSCFFDDGEVSGGERLYDEAADDDDDDDDVNMD